MTSINIRREGRAGRITLQRPQALNALTYEMATAIENALDRWVDDNEVTCVLIDAEGDKAFCAGGDLQSLYDTGQRGDFEYGRRFWRDEYRLNAKIANYPKPYIAMMQGYTMGGGVGISCHGSHRVVGESSRIAMPECGVGLVPDVGGSWLLARAPGRLGEFLGTTAARMSAPDAIFAGFADYYVPERDWPDLIWAIEICGAPDVIPSFAVEPPECTLNLEDIDAVFAHGTAAEIVAALKDTGNGETAIDALGKHSPLSVVCTLDLVRAVREEADLKDALELEYRFTSRSASQGDFLEGIRAMIVDKDRAPNWKHRSLMDVPDEDRKAMLAPLGDAALTL